jgi:peptidyl-prolyl cis-trans isomerase A (cyclophilin A)
LKSLAFSLVVVSLLSACGGNDSPSAVNKPKITSVTTDQLIYRKTTVMTVKGENLSAGFNMNNPACLKITELAGGSDTQKTFSCKIVGVGSQSFVITDSAANSLYAQTLNIPLAKQPQVTMTTNMGTMVFELNPAKAPISVDNFLNYTESGFYVNKIFHRVISNFVIQGGGYTADLTLATTQAPIKLEANNGLSNVRGSLAMARTAVADSATSQFFINVIDNVSLDTSSGGYAVFGKVVTGLDIVDKIKAVPTSTRGGLADVPNTAIVINSMVQTQ